MKFSYLIFTAVSLLLIVTCKHDPVIPENSMDTNPVDTTDTDTTQNPNIIPCDPDSVYFENDILPIFEANCIHSPCHDDVNPQKGLRLNNWQSIKDIAEGSTDPDDSELFERLLETDIDDLMPRVVGEDTGRRLDPAQIDLIKLWVQQGSQNNSCTECDTAVVTFSQDILPLLNRSCNTSTACHGEGVTSRPHWGNYQVISNNINKIENRVINFRGTASQMPQLPRNLPDCDVLKLKKWIDNGAEDN